VRTTFRLRGRRELVRIHPYLEPHVAKRLQEYSAARGLKASWVVQAALLEHFDRDGDLQLVLRRFNRLDQAVARLQNDHDFLGEAVAVFVRLWLANTPELPDEDKDPARRKSETRFGRFLKHAIVRFKNGPRFFDATASVTQAKATEPTEPAGQSPPSAAPSDEYVATLIGEDDDEE
jgi:hypothetical protein